MAGYVCHTHFIEPHDYELCTHLTVTCNACYRANEARRHARNARHDACPDCQTFRANTYNEMQRRDTIDPFSCYGEHILLTCENHPDLTWTRKNINSPRSIFFTSPEPATECDCFSSRLFSPGRLINHLIRLYFGDPIFNQKG